MPQRYLIVGITAVAALFLYIDRVCISILADDMKGDLGLSDAEKENVLSAYFFTYALFPIPVGALADRYGPRLVLTVSIAAWSVVTAMTGLAWSFAALVAARLMLGITEAGAYPAAAALVKRWAKPEERGRFSSIVALGGRIGGAIAPKLTATLGLGLLGVAVFGVSAGDSGVHWRGVFLLYGTLGVGMALLFWAVVRDHPPAGSGTGVGTPAADPQAPPAEPAGKPLTFLQRLGVLSRNRGMWFFGGLQFCNNISWAFLVTLLPTFLKDADVKIELRGDLQTTILFGGCVGMVLGGLMSDAARRRFGPRWGRSVPIVAMMTCCALMCAVASTSPGLWVTVAALAMMSLCQDAGNPSVWAYAQDVGGKNVGAALGFGNMLGNFGAALSPRLLGEVQRAGGWDAVFALCACVYVSAALCGLMLDASKPVDERDA
jgi:ACS family glucarate transporter-like MFS transporter